MMSAYEARDLDTENFNDIDTAGVTAADIDQDAGTKGSGFPLARIKKIIKADSDVNLVSAEAVHLTSIASVSRVHSVSSNLPSFHARPV